MSKTRPLLLLGCVTSLSVLGVSAGTASAKTTHAHRLIFSVTNKRRGIWTFLKQLYYL